MDAIKLTFVAIAAAIACAAAWTAKADTVESDVVFVTLKADGSTNTWTQADLVAALGLLNRKYHRDCETPSGRKAWHGKLKKEIVNTNDLTKTEVYEDGTTFSMPAKIVTPSQAVANANKNRLANKNGIPAKLAQARMLRMQEKSTTNIVEKVLKAGE